MSIDRSFVLLEANQTVAQALESVGAQPRAHFIIIRRETSQHVSWYSFRPDEFTAATKKATSPGSPLSVALELREDTVRPTHIDGSDGGQPPAFSIVLSKGGRLLGVAVEPSTPLKIYVGNLPFSTSADEVRRLFEPYGKVESVGLITDRDTGRPRGFGFVEMDGDEADKAIAALNGQQFGGRPLRVRGAEVRLGAAGAAPAAAGKKAGPRDPDDGGPKQQQQQQQEQRHGFRRQQQQQLEEPQPYQLPAWQAGASARSKCSSPGQLARRAPTRREVVACRKANYAPNGTTARSARTAAARGNYSVHRPCYPGRVYYSPVSATGKPTLAGGQFRGVILRRGCASY